MLTSKNIFLNWGDNFFFQSAESCYIIWACLQHFNCHKTFYISSIGAAIGPGGQPPTANNARSSSRRRMVNLASPGAACEHPGLNWTLAWLRNLEDTSPLSTSGGVDIFVSYTFVSYTRFSKKLMKWRRVSYKILQWHIVSYLQWYIASYYFSSDVKCHTHEKCLTRKNL